MSLQRADERHGAGRLVLVGATTAVLLIALSHVQ